MKIGRWSKYIAIPPGILLLPLLLLFSSGLIRAGASEEDEVDDDTCCVCLVEGCCARIDADLCDAEGNLEHPDIIEDLLDTLGIDASEFCNTCEQCAENTFSSEEDRQFLDVCDLCLFEPIVESHRCTSAPSSTILEEEDGCRLNPFSTGKVGGSAVVIGIWILGTLGWRLKLGSEQRSRSS